jgi:hypothetical protein
MSANEITPLRSSRSRRGPQENTCSIGPRVESFVPIDPQLPADPVERARWSARAAGAGRAARARIARGDGVRAGGPRRRSRGRAIAPAPPGDGDWIDVRFEDGCPVIAGRIPGPSGPRDGLFALDTGSSAAVTIAAGAGPLIEMRGRGRVSVRGVSGTGSARAGELAWLELAGHRLDEVAVVVSRPGTGATGDPTPEPRVLGSIGMAVLAEFALSLDYPRRRVQLRRRKRATLRARPR